MPRKKTDAPDAAQQVEPRWLDDTEMQTWLPLLRVVQLLPQSLDRQLREQAGINHVYYMLLVILSGQPEQKLPLTELARLAAISQSRASHAVTSLEQKGWVQRQPCPTDRRVQFIVLTDAGMQVLSEAAPGHVAEVRRLVFDQLDAADLADLRRVTLKLVAVLDE
ncbi:MAG: MarR family transcriptional regulator [Frankiales bacterium]|jgi:DNA-binding MarR family transcriptional regulator|nr:MarR family transcriptional regulator [Frankiales bacterium]